jgi:hypothetical protein
MTSGRTAEALVGRTIRMRRARIAAALLSTACGSSQSAVTAKSSVPAVAHSATSVTIPPSPAAEAISAPKPRPLGLQEAMCGPRAECVAKTAFTGAPGKDGDARSVVLVPFKLSTSAGDESHECQANEVWVVRTAENGMIVDRQLIGDGCVEDTPYGGACDGLSVIRVQPPNGATPKTVVVGWEGPGPGCGGWTRTSSEVEVSLESFAMLRRSEWAGRTRDPDDSEWIVWDFAEWSFKSEWQTSAGPCPPRKRGPSFGIPKLALGSAFLDGGWRTASMDQCATTIDSNHSVRFRGTAKSKAVLRAVVSETDTLFVDAADANSKPGTELRICFAMLSAHMYDYCHMPRDTDCLRVALNGQVLAGKTAVERAPDRPRFRIQLPPETTALSVSLAEAGSPVISSSAVHRDDSTSLGSIFSLGAEVVSCSLDGDHLQRSTPPRSPDRGLLDWTGLH